MNAFSLSRHADKLSDVSKISRQNVSLLDEKRSFISRLFMLWLSPLLKKGSKKTLIYDDLPMLRQKYRSINLIRHWRIESREGLVRKLVLRHRWSLLAAVVAKFLAEVLDYVNPLLLKLLIESTAVPGSITRCLTVCVIMFGIGEVKSLLLGIHNYMVVRDATSALSLIMNSISKKSLRLANSSRVQWPASRIVNLVAVDAEALVTAAPYVHHAWAGVLQITLALLLTYMTIGVPAVGAVLVMLLYVPFNYICSRIIKSYQVKQMQLKDRRLKFTSEVIHGISIVKMYTWEEAFEKEISELRNKEVSYLRKASLLTRVVQSVNSAAPYMVAIACFSWFVLSSPENILMPSVAFVALTVFKKLRRPMALLAPSIQFISKAIVCGSRINDFLQAEELERSKDVEGDDEISITLENCFFSWKNEKEHLKDITLHVQQGEVHAVVGPVGSGKSTLLSAILGEMNRLDGKRKVSGTIAYVPQRSWILNQTENNVERNVVFYVLRVCELKKDIFSLPRCDATLIGENGTALSGGQRSRVCVARALYQDCDIFIMDEPFSSVDASVACSMYEKMFGRQGALSKKTVVYATHSVEFTKNATLIHVLDGGKIVDRGTYEELLERSEIFSQLKRQRDEAGATAKFEEKTATKLHKKTKTVMFEPPQPPDVRQVETVAEGRIKGNVYLTYLKALSYKWVTVFLVLIICHYITQALSNVWLSRWANNNAKQTDSSNTTDGLIIYVILGVVIVLFNIAAAISSTYGSMRASLALHRPLVKSIMRAPLQFFEETPIGRILSRLSGDVDIIDIPLPMNIRLVVDSIIHIATILVVISISMPVYVVFVVPFTICYAMILKYFLPSNRQIKRIESAQRSQLLAVLSQNIDGADSIRAYRRVKTTLLSFYEDVDSFVRCRYLAPATARWLTLRLELIGNIMVFACAVLVSLFNEMDLITAGEVGLCVSYALSITDLMNFSVRMMALSEANIVAVERIKEYHDLESESKTRSDYPLLDSWPHSGTIEFRNFCIRYGKSEKMAVKNLTLTIKGGEKIGIVGRTGSGKTSIARGLLRLVEKAEGDVFIDGVNIAELGLQELRSRITIIPQDPVLFSSTLRFNVDPFNHFADSDIWLALEACQVKEMASKHKAGLLMEIEEGGKNISSGERQLLCLCRSLLEGGKILILDETTASLDYATQVVRECFQQATIISIAHKLETIGECDKVAVMEDGEMVEFDSPSNLLAKEDSIFREMVQIQRTN
ncbi:hypothetical protein Q1695_003475 [Nippostrongylus brasiliensis]|nr:hypothetical protein Q1695_003475 [Nippostrongylus brasiliensis]